MNSEKAQIGMYLWSQTLRLLIIKTVYYIVRATTLFHNVFEKFSFLDHNLLLYMSDIIDIIK